jgi:hypothetical protein
MSSVSMRERKGLEGRGGNIYLSIICHPIEVTISSLKMKEYLYCLFLFLFLYIYIYFLIETHKYDSMGGLER